jgi:hypothetical protein
VDEAAAVRATADAFWAACLSGDGVAITSLMSPNAREWILRHMRRWDPAVSTAEEAAARAWGAREVGFVSSIVTDSVELHGTQAIARYDLPALDYGHPDEDDYVVLVKVDGRWVVDSFPDDDDPDERPIWAYDS